MKCVLSLFQEYTKHEHAITEFNKLLYFREIVNLKVLRHSRSTSRKFKTFGKFLQVKHGTIFFTISLNYLFATTIGS
jgi:hypothetical protein